MSMVLDLRFGLFPSISAGFELTLQFCCSSYKSDSLFVLKNWLEAQREVSLWIRLFSRADALLFPLLKSSRRTHEEPLGKQRWSLTLRRVQPLCLFASTKRGHCDMRRTSGISVGQIRSLTSVPISSWVVHASDWMDRETGPTPQQLSGHGWFA